MLRYLKAILWTVFIFIISAIPGSTFPKPPVPDFDKLVHSGVYFVLYFLFAAAFYSRNMKIALKTQFVIALLCVLYGGILEYLQSAFFIMRSGSWLDFLANALGVVVGIFAVNLLEKKQPGLLKKI